VQSGSQSPGSHSPLVALHTSSAAHSPPQATSLTWLPDSENPSVRAVAVSLEQPVAMAATHPASANPSDVDRLRRVSATMQLLLRPARGRVAKESGEEDESVDDSVSR